MLANIFKDDIKLFNDSKLKGYFAILTVRNAFDHL